MTEKKEINPRQFLYALGKVAEGAILNNVKGDRKLAKEVMAAFVKLFIVPEDHEKIDTYQREHPIAFRNRLGRLSLKYGDLFDQLLKVLKMKPRKLSKLVVQNISDELCERIMQAPLPFSNSALFG